MSVLELKVPPPIVAVVLALLMWLTPPVAGIAQIPYATRVLCSVVLVCVGQGIGIAGMIALGTSSQEDLFGLGTTRMQTHRIRRVHGNCPCSVLLKRSLRLDFERISNLTAARPCIRAEVGPRRRCPSG